MRLSMVSIGIRDTDPWPICPFCATGFDVIGPDGKHAAHTCEPTDEQMRLFTKTTEAVWAQINAELEATENGG